jgi:Ca2+/Na+ antiporter
MDLESLAFNICAFIASLFLLEWGADRFIDHTVVVAKRLGVSPVLVSLLTAGAEWEEVSQRRHIL